MFYFDKDDYKEKDKDATEPSDFAKKLSAIADEKEAEDANKVEQPDPTAGYEVGETNVEGGAHHDPDHDAEILIAPGTVDAVHTGGVLPNQPHTAGTVVPPIIVSDDDAEVVTDPRDEPVDER